MERILSGRRRTFAALVVLLLACTGLTACWPLSGPKQVKVYATVDDVGDMAKGAPVEISDVKIGHVTAIKLDKSQTKARLTIEVRASARVPAAVEARIRRTTPLGEKFVELKPLADAGPALLYNRQEIGGIAVADVQDLVTHGTALFAALSADQIATLVSEGAKAFGGRGAQLNKLVVDLDSITKGYASRTGTISNLVRDIKTLTDSLAPNAQANAQLFTNLAQTTQILNDQSNHFLDLLSSLSNLARQTNSLITAHFDRIVTQTHTLQVVTSQLANQQIALGNILKYLPAHNATTTLGVVNDFAQTLNDFVICGIPGGGEIMGDAVNDCGPYFPSAQNQ